MCRKSNFKKVICVTYVFKHFKFFIVYIAYSKRITPTTIATARTDDLGILKGG